MFLEFVGTVRAASLVAVHSTLALDARNMLLCSQMLYSMAKAWSEPCVWTCLARAEHPVRYVTGLGIAGFVFLCFGIGLLTAYGLHRSLLQCSKPWDTATTGSIRQVLHAFASRSRRLFWKLWIMRGVWESWVMSLMIHGGLQLTTVHGLLVIGWGSAWQTRCAMVQLGLTCWFTFWNIIDETMVVDYGEFLGSFFSTAGQLQPDRNRNNMSARKLQEYGLACSGVKLVCWWKKCRFGCMFLRNAWHLFHDWVLFHPSTGLAEQIIQCRMAMFFWVCE